MWESYWIRINLTGSRAGIFFSKTGRSIIGIKQKKTCRVFNPAGGERYLILFLFHERGSYIEFEVVYFDIIFILHHFW